MNLGESAAGIHAEMYTCDDLETIATHQWTQYTYETSTTVSWVVFCLLACAIAARAWRDVWRAQTIARIKSDAQRKKSDV